MRTFKRLLRFLIDVPALLAGWLAFAVTGNTSQRAAQTLVRMFCVTGGRSNDLMSRLISLRYPPRRLDAMPGALAGLDQTRITEISATLRERGYFVYANRVPQDICDRLLNFALTRPAKVRPGDAQSRAELTTAVYDPARPLAVRYDFDEKDLVNHPDVQALMADPALIAVAQAYLGAQPVADVVTMWWHTAFSDKPDAEAAQLFHFDMDRIKWVKFFIYLTDVASENGPHYFVAGSHRTGGIAPELLSKGYARLEDEEVKQHYRPQDIIEFAAPQGTILAEDTRGLHKGQHVHKGHRLMLQIQFSNSLFGPPYPKVSFDAVQDQCLVAMARRHPRIYSAYTIGTGGP